MECLLKMLMKRVLVLSILSVLYVPVHAQMTIEGCYEKARTNYPLIKQHALIEKSREYNLSNANKGYLPQVMFSAKVSYQSEVTKLPISMPGINIEGLSKDQYSATVDVSQTIWDGGVIKSRKESVITGSRVDEANLEVTLYAINERVNQIYFGILLFDEKIKQNELLQEELQRNFDKVTAYVRNGVASQTDVDAIRVEQIKAQQNKSQLEHTQKGYCDMLATLIGESIDANVKFEKPKAIFSSKTTVNRPELMMYDAQIKNMETKRQEINAGLMPTLGLFLTGGYGKPGLNMLNNEFSGYYVGGVRLSWNLGSLYTNKNSKRLIDSNINSLETQRETFLFNTNLDILSKSTEIEKYRDQLKYDEEIVALRNSIKRASEAKIANGTISGIDLMRDVNSEDLAKQDKILHEIEMLLAIYNLKYVTNN